ncbi:MAG: transglutaminase [Ignavibacteria bacterium]|nr:transglutaminase [Ignavibacteria bacterium]
MKKYIFLICIIFLLNSISLPYTGEIIKYFDAPGKFPTGLCFDGKNLWVADRETDKLYCINPETGSIIRMIESPAYWPMGIAYDGQYLWNSDIRGLTDKSEDYDGMIFKINQEDGTILKTLNAPCKSPIGLTYDGKYFWCIDDRSDKVIQFSPVDGTTIKSFKAPSQDVTGICFDGKYLWISDRILDEIYMVDPETGYVILIADAPGKYVFGLATDGNKLWAVDYQEDKIFQLKIRDNEKMIQKNPQYHKVVFSHSVKCFGPGKIKTLDIDIALAENRDNQVILEPIEYNIPPTDILTDKWGQKTAHWSFSNINPGESKNIKVTTIFKTYLVRYFIYPEFVGGLNEIPTEIKEKYLEDDEKYQIHSEIIQRTVKEVVGDEKNPYWIIRKIHQFVINHLTYLMDGMWDTAPTVIMNKHGSCSEYSFVFIALCRAAGIPTRYVGSTWIKKDEASMDEVYHRWVEVYLPNYGWIPTDPTHGDRELPRDQAYPIGYVSNNALITTQSCGASETLEWTYNSNINYTTEPKTNLNITHFADWEPVDKSKYGE